MDDQATVATEGPSADGAGGDRSSARLMATAPKPLRRLLRAAERRRAGGGTVLAVCIVLATTAALVGWIHSGIDDETGVSRWDSAAAEFGRDQATDVSTRVLDVLTDLGAALAVFTLMALIGVYHAVKRSDVGPLAYLAVVGFGVGVVNNLLKLLIGRDRPAIAQLADSAGSSFPSGHTAVAAACWAAIALVVTRGHWSHARRLAAAGAIGVAVVVAATRVLLGVHWLSDVAAGLLVGWGWWLVTTIIFGRRILTTAAAVDDSLERPDHVTARQLTDPTEPHETSH